MRGNLPQAVLMSNAGANQDNEKGKSGKATGVEELS
jgi:hypothetical protein